MVVYRAKCDRRCARKLRPAQQGSNDEQDHAPRTFACGGFIKSIDRRIGLEGILVEQDGEVRVASVRNELVSDVENVITGFL